MPKLKTTTQRRPLSSVIFQLMECMDAYDVLEEADKIHQTMLNPSKVVTSSSFPRHLIAPLVGVARDTFCSRIATLFDKRKDSHSLKKYYKGEAIDKLEKNPVVQACIRARHGNIAHVGKKYTKWPKVNDILKSDIRNELQSIKSGVFLYGRH